MDRIMGTLQEGVPGLSSVSHYTNAHPIISSLGGFVFLLAFYWFWTVILKEWRLTYRNLNGPPSTHWLWGNLNEIIKAEPLVMQEKWAKEYGPTYRYTFMFHQPRFYTADPKALGYILNHPDNFPKPDRVRRNLERTLGNGLLVAEGDPHRRQRKALNPSFSPLAVKNCHSIFWDKAYELREKLDGIIGDESLQAAPTPEKPEDKVAGGKKIDMSKYIQQATLDVIGLAGFNYDFKSLSQPYNELAEAYRDMFAQGQNLTIWLFLASFIPGFDKIPTKQQKIIRASQATTRRIGKRLLEEKKKAVREAYRDGFEKGSDVGKDLLSILVKANMASDLKPEQRMSDDEVLAQITTFMLAGNETSATSLGWILYMLSQNPDCQKRLREELMTIEEERPSPEDLAAIPYLDAVVRESLRLLPPATGTIRETRNTAVVPLGIPVRGRDGKMIDSVTLEAGTPIFVPIMSVNKSTELWGPDADTFNPDRFLKPTPEKTNDVPGVWGHQMTFLGGIRSCIGYRFALAEIKAILFVLIKSFEFEELGSKPKIEKKSSVVMRARIIGEENEGFQMPLMVKPVSE